MWTVRLNIAFNENGQTCMSCYRRRGPAEPVACRALSLCFALCAFYLLRPVFLFRKFDVLLTWRIVVEVVGVVGARDSDRNVSSLSRVLGLMGLCLELIYWAVEWN